MSALTRRTRWTNARARASIAALFTFEISRSRFSSHEPRNVSFLSQRATLGSAPRIGHFAFATSRSPLCSSLRRKRKREREGASFIYSIAIKRFRMARTSVYLPGVSSRECSIVPILESCTNLTLQQSLP